MFKILTYGLGYLRRPYLWRDLLRQPGRLLALRQPRERSRNDARIWAERRAVPTNEAIELIGKGTSCTDGLDREHPETLAQARAMVDSLPVRLGGPGNVDLLYELVRIRRPSTIVETGVAAGWSSLAMLLAIEENGNGRLISIDRPDMKLGDDRLIGAAVPDRLRGNWRLLLGVDRDMLPHALADAGTDLSLAHYDSDKSYFGRMWAYELIMQYLSVGGILISDDIADNTAFMDFCESANTDPIIVSYGESGYCGIVVKRQPTQ